MKLTGKAKDDFIKWHKENYSYISFEKFESEEEFNKHRKCRKVLINSLIIEWFDSVGIYIEISKSADVFWLYDIKINNEKIYISALEPMQRTRQEATEKAIEKANLIYNNMK